MDKAKKKAQKEAQKISPLVDNYLYEYSKDQEEQEI